MRTHWLYFYLFLILMLVFVLQYFKPWFSLTLLSNNCHDCDQTVPLRSKLKTSVGRGRVGGLGSDDFSLFCRRLWKNNPISLDDDKDDTPNTICSCQDTPHTFGSFNKSAIQRRNKEFMEWKRQQKIIKEPLIYTPAVSPFTYVAGGLTVRPGKSIAIKPIHIDPIAVQCLTVIKDFSLQNNAIEASFTCSKAKGILFIPKKLANLTKCIIKGNNTNNLTISINIHQRDIQLKYDVIANTINNALQSIQYHNYYYDIFTRDVIKVEFLGYTFEINVLIKERNLPRLYDTGPNNDISQKVTIVTKTFERPDAVTGLVKSIRKYYPNVTVIIADDSKTPLSFEDDKIKYYTMPFAEGWFAGRNLVLSQVRTKYFLWADDDFVFTEETDLSKAIEKLEINEENLDIVAGIVVLPNRSLRIQSITTSGKVIEITDGDISGDCLYRQFGVLRKLRNYPQCHMASIVTNFFMAKTLSVRSIGFDPEFERVGHSEFFFDGFGYLRVAFCSDFVVNHHQTRPKIYKEYRTRKVDPLDMDRNVQHILFKNYLKCFELN